MSPAEASALSDAEDPLWPRRAPGRFPGGRPARFPAPPGARIMLAVIAPVFVSVVPDTRGMLPQERYTYSVPDDLSERIRPGVRVQVPFGARSLPGLVVAILDQSDHADARPISAVLDEEPLLSEAMVGLAEWIAERYCAPLPEVIKAMVPKGARTAGAATGRRRGPRTTSAALTAARAEGTPLQPPVL